MSVLQQDLLLCRNGTMMGKILLFKNKKKSVKKQNSYLEYMKGIINGYATRKIIPFPFNNLTFKRKDK